MGETKTYEFSRQPRFLPDMPRGEVEIPSPPMAYEKPEISWLLILLPPGVMLVITIIFALSAQSMFLLMSVALTLVTALGSVMGATSQITKYKRQKESREKNYLQLIADIRADLKISREKQINAMNEMNPPPSLCLQRISNLDSKVWERKSSHTDFLSLRLGLGSVASAVKVKYSKQHMILDNDPLAREPEKIALEFQRVNEVPVCVDLFSTEICGIAGDQEAIDELLRIMLLQLVTHHGYDDVRVVLLLKENSLEDWGWARFLPHLWEDQFRSRYLLCGRVMAHHTLDELYEVLKARELTEKQFGQANTNLPHYIFIVEDPLLLENEAISKYTYNGSKNIGVSTIAIAENKAYLPMNCKTVINLQAGTGEYANKESGEKTTFIIDRVGLKEVEKGARKLAPLRLKSPSFEFNLPQSITLMEMLGKKSVEEVDVLSLWQKNKTYKGMSVPIGARPGKEPFYLDIHETGFGPHGLVAGTTGSGKSELLQSIIISLAINYHPHDISFVLIDYKGGGMADIFSGLPHLVGTITNLGGNQTVRALISIKSELQRRQRIFSEYGVNNIDKYQKLYHNGGTKEPLPHLVMIADEFAELKAEQPEFMKELVSAARVGRSLGVHLILATQKPAGVVDDQIWSNSRFKICLKVQDETDSKDVIKRPDAARIKEPGRAYIQVGNDEVFEMFQATWSGADYDPDGELEKNEKKVKRLFKIHLNGKAEQIYPIDEDKIVNHELPSQLKAMVDYISSVAKKNKIQALKGPWLPPLPEKVFLDEIFSEYQGFDYELGTWKAMPKSLEVPIGIVDDPRNQSQKPLFLDFSSEGHLIVYGAPGTGKTYLLETICLSLSHLFSPEEVNIYLMDFGGTGLKKFNALPHCGGVITLEQESRINQFVQFIFRIIEERKKLFEKLSVDNFNSYKAKFDEELPAIFLMVDNYFALSETYELADEKMIVLAREGAKFGIYLIATATNAGLVKYKFAVNFKIAISLQLTEKTEYEHIVGRTEGLEPAPVPGRGLVRNRPPLEFQTALPQLANLSTESLIDKFHTFAEEGKITKAKPIPEMPVRIDIRQINRTTSPNTIAIGLTDEELQSAHIDLMATPTLLIAGDSQTGKSTLLVCWVRVLLETMGDKVKLYAQDSQSMGLYSIINEPQVTDLGQIPDMFVFIEDIKSIIDHRRGQLNECRRNNGSLEELYSSWQQLVFVFDDLNEFSHTGDYALKELLERIVKREYGLKVAILAAGITNDLANNYDAFAKAVRETQSGILLGSLRDQNLYGVRIPYGSAEKEIGFGDGYYVVRNKYVGLRLALMS